MSTKKFYACLFKIYAITFLMCMHLHVHAQQKISVDPNTRYQTIKGWGTSLCWWANMAGGFPDAKVNEICSWITDPNELNMNVFRYNIGGGDNPTHNHLRTDGGAVPGFKTSATAAYNWNSDANQRKILLKLNALRTDVINEAFSNSPPYYMTKSGCSSGNTDGSDNLNDNQYTAFASYLTDVVQYYKEHYNITFSTLEPFNEPFSNWWKANGGQEGCKFGQSNQQKMIPELYAQLIQKNMLSYCNIAAMDANNIDECVNGINGYASAGNILSKITQINTHSYSGSGRTTLAGLAGKYKKDLWQSESGPLSVSSTGLDNHLIVAERIIADLRDMKAVVWCDWQIMTANDPNWGLIPADYAKQTYSKAKSYYVRMQCSRFIKKGYTVIESSLANSVAAINEAGTELVLVLTNRGSQSAAYTLDLSSFQSVGSSVVYRTSATEDCKQIGGVSAVNKTISYTAPANTITTFIMPVSNTVTAIGAGEDKPVSVPVCWPNPFTGELNIVAEGDFNFEVYDLQGRKMEEGKGSGKFMAGSKLNEGQYFIRVIQGEVSKSFHVVKKE